MVQHHRKSDREIQMAEILIHVRVSSPHGILEESSSKIEREVRLAKRRSLCVSG